MYASSSGSVFYTRNTWNLECTWFHWPHVKSLAPTQNLHKCWQVSLHRPHIVLQNTAVSFVIEYPNLPSTESSLVCKCSNRKSIFSLATLQWLVLLQCREWGLPWFVPDQYISEFLHSLFLSTLIPCAYTDLCRQDYKNERRICCQRQSENPSAPQQTLLSCRWTGWVSPVLLSNSLRGSLTTPHFQDIVQEARIVLYTLTLLETSIRSVNHGSNVTSGSDMINLGMVCH